MRTYFLDDEEVDWKVLIKKAKECGYDDDIKYTSVAAGILRDHGHRVEDLNMRITRLEHECELEKAKLDGMKELIKNHDPS